MHFLTKLTNNSATRSLKTRWLRSRLTPASRHWGTERGKPLDRIYLEHFLKTYQTDICGRVLEIGGKYYTDTFGSNVTQSVSYDVLPGSGIDIVGDLTSGIGLEDESFDCLVILQTLMMIHDIQSAADTLHRLVKPGGSALITVNFIAPNCVDDCQEMWQWNMTPNAAEKLISDRFGEENVTVVPYGNYAVASSFLAGLAAEDVNLDYWQHEPGYEVLIGIKAVKPHA